MPCNGPVIWVIILTLLQGTAGMCFGKINPSFIIVFVIDVCQERFAMRRVFAYLSLNTVSLNVCLSGTFCQLSSVCTIFCQERSAPRLVSAGTFYYLFSIDICPSGTLKYWAGVYTFCLSGTL